MATTEIGSGYTTSSKRTQKAIAHSEAAALVHLERDRSTLYGGICSNCEKLATCKYPSATSETWFCEEYNFAKPPKQALPVNYDVEERADVKTGLCMNCELRGTCTLPKPVGGVWFCNEYE